MLHDVARQESKLNGQFNQTTKSIFSYTVPLIAQHLSMQTFLVLCMQVFGINIQKSASTQYNGDAWNFGFVAQSFSETIFCVITKSSRA